MHRLKFKHFGHDTVVMHEREIRTALPPFSFLMNAQRRAEFMSDITAMIEAAPFTLIAAAIRDLELEFRRVCTDNALKTMLDHEPVFSKKDANQGQAFREAAACRGLAGKTERRHEVETARGRTVGCRRRALGTMPFPSSWQRGAKVWGCWMTRP